MALNSLQKEHLFTVQELEQEGKAWPCFTLVRNVCVEQLKVFTMLHMCISTNDHKSTISIDLGVYK